jgi:predicted permease
MGIPLRRGRLFDAHDDATTPKVALLSESYAARVFHGLDPIGQRLRIGPADGPPYTIIGIVGDVRQQSLTLSQSDAVYMPAVQWLFPDNAMSLVVRSRGNGAAMVPAIQQAIWSVDADQPIVRLATMDHLVDASAAERRFALVLFEAFALAALVLAAAGIYGVLSGSVVERTREIGVRAALGASRGMIVGLVLRQGMALTGVGLAIGLAAAIAASPAIAALLFGVSRLDPVTYASVIALLAAVAALACLVPAWRAARVDPVTTLRAE